MPYSQGPVLKMLGTAERAAIEPLPLDKIRARRMQREAAELEEYKADTSRINADTNKAVADENISNSRLAKKQQADMKAEMAAYPKITAPYNTDQYWEQHHIRAQAFSNSNYKPLYDEGQEMMKNYQEWQDKKVGRSLQQAQLDEQARQHNVPKAKGPGTPRTYYEPGTNKPMGTAQDNTPESRALMAQGGILEPQTEALAANFAQTDKVLMRKNVAAVQQAENQLVKAQRAFDDWGKAPRSGGITGSVAENFGGLLGQIPVAGESMEDAINKMFTGGTTEQATRARTAALTLAADLLPEITGEESGRFTEAERELAFRTLRQLKATSSPAMVAEAFRVFIEASVNAADRERIRGGNPPAFDTSTPIGSMDYANNLIDRGFTKEQAKEALKRRIRERSLSGG